MLVRGPSLAESMSQYLIDRIAAADNIEVLTETEITASRVRPKGLSASSGAPRTGAARRKPIRKPSSSAQIRQRAGSAAARAWTPKASFGQVRLSRPRHEGKNGPRRPLPLEAEVANVFAVGDVRAGSVKRVGAAIGEGAAAVAQIHTVLSNASVPPTAREQSARLMNASLLS